MDGIHLKVTGYLGGVGCGVDGHRKEVKKRD
jgi:hypothetical protein